MSDNRGTREYAVNGTNAIVCDAGNVSQFANAVKLLSADAGLCGKLGENGRKTAEKYSIEKSIANMAEIYGRYIGLPGRKNETGVLSGENR